MALIPTASKQSPVAEAIYAEYVKQNLKWKRPHLGASVIGNPCERALWYGFRWCSEPHHPGRILRLFETGQLEEPRVVHDLRAIGCTVHEVDPATGRQFHYRDHGGHFCGSLDGAVLGVPTAEKTWHLLEIKTHSLNSFTKLKLQGVTRSKPLHHAQMVCYMGWTGLTRALYFAVCKDNDEIHTERLHEDKEMFARIRERALRVITAEAVPGRQSLDCEFCDHKAVCFEDALPLIHCRTCRSAMPVMDGGYGKWVCRRDLTERTVPLQERGCENHLFIPSLVGFARAVEEHQDYVVYEKGKTFFVNSIPSSFPACAGECFASADLGRAR